MKRYSLEWNRRSDLMEMCEDSDGDWVRYEDHAALAAILLEGVPYTDKLTGRTDRVCPGCAAVLDDRGWLCAPGCPVADFRKEDEP